MYDLYTVKDSPCELLVSLPLARVYKMNPSLFEGLNSLRLETVDGGEEDKSETYSNLALSYIKDTETQTDNAHC